MRAMVYTAPLEMQYLDIEEPVAHEGEVLVEVAEVGICGSELEGFISKSPFRIPPLVMGHEFAGRRADTGDRVVVNPVVSCWRCDLCLAGRPNICRYREIIGIQRPGAFASRVVVPEVNCYPIPTDTDGTAYAMVEPLANAIHAVSLAFKCDAILPRVGVIGAGTLGFLAALTAKASGVAHVSIADLSPERREMAELSGADAIAESLLGEYDAIFDAVGSAATRAMSVDLLRPGGTAVWMGLHGTEAGFDGLALIRQEKKVLGTFCYTDADFRLAIERASTLPSDVVDIRPLSDGVEAFMDLVGGNMSSLKTVLRP